MKNINIFLVGAALSAAAVAPASGQSGATPEAAQKFIEIVLKQGATRAEVSDVQIEKYMDQGWNCNGMTSCYFTLTRTGSAYWTGAPSKCTTGISVSFTETSWRGDHATMYVKESPQVQLNWATMSSASNSDGSPTVAFAGPGRVRYMTFATPELAKRVTNAFDTLIKACDPTAGTGF